MILQLLLRTPLWRLTAVLSTVSAILVAFSPATGTFMMPLVLITLPRLMVPRATRFESALPIRARQITVARNLLMLALIWLPLLTWILAPGAQGPIRSLFEISLSVKLEVLGIATLAVLVPNLVGIGQLEVPPMRMVGVPWLALALGSWLAIRSLPSPVFLALLALAIVAASWFVLSRTPQSFQLAGATAARVPIVSASSIKISLLGAATGGSWLPVLRSVFSPFTLLSAASAIVFGLMDNWPLFVAMYVLILLSRIWRQTRWLYGLPLSHRRVMLVTVLPAVLPVLCGLAIGMVAGPSVYRSNSIGYRAPHSDSSEARFHRDTRVALDLWQRAPGGDAPMLRAPWGETGASDALSILGLTLYNPYSVEKNASKRFLEWQFGRASQAVYGHVISYDVYTSRASMRPQRAAGALTGYILSGGFAITFALLVIFLCGIPRWHALSRQPWTQTAAGFLVSAALLGLGVLDLHYLRMYSTNLVVPLSKAAILNISQALPGGAIGAVFICVLPLIAMYYLLTWQVGKSEFTKLPWIMREWRDL